MDRTTLGSIVGAAGTLVAGLGYFWPEHLAAFVAFGALVSAAAKTFTGTQTQTQLAGNPTLASEVK